MIRMKMFSLMLMMLVLVFAGACAEEALPQEVLSVLEQEYPGYTLIQSDRCDPAAAAVVSDDGTQVLCLAEKQDGEWKLVVSNPAALRQDAPVSSLLLDTDEALFWSYHGENVASTLYAARRNGTWKVVSMQENETYPNGNVGEHALGYGDGRLQYSTYLCDENDNILSMNDYEPVPAAWLNDRMELSVFDESAFPKANINYTHSWLSDEAIMKAAEELFPGYACLGGCAKRSHLEFFLKSPGGELLFAATRFDEKLGWRSSMSTPLPKDTRYGLENFSSSLVIGDLLVNVSPVDENQFGVTYIYNHASYDGSSETMFQLGRNWVCMDVPVGYGNVYGDHPWADITMMDWQSLPHTFEEALAGLDSSSWAVVNNPNPQDRLHLRTKADKDAQSLGKYYNGTPVRVLEEKKNWVRVNIFGVEGWMMKEYLAFDDRGRSVEAAFPNRMPLESKKDHYLYASPEKDNPVENFRELHQGLLVLGIVGEEWYHVWVPEQFISGYVLQADWFEGNG